MSYVIKRTSDGQYVAKPGRESSYTSSLRWAQKFSTRDAAAGAKCDNEYVTSVQEEVGY